MATTITVVATNYTIRWPETKAFQLGQQSMWLNSSSNKLSITRHGVPRHFLSDRERYLSRIYFTELLQIMGVELQYTTSYHAQCNEWANKDVVKLWKTS